MELGANVLIILIENVEDIFPVKQEAKRVARKRSERPSSKVEAKSNLFASIGIVFHSSTSSAAEI